MERTYTDEQIKAARDTQNFSRSAFYQNHDKEEMLDLFDLLAGDHASVDDLGSINKVKLTNTLQTLAQQIIDTHITAARQELDATKADDALRGTCMSPLETLRAQVTTQESLAHIAQAETEAERLFDKAIALIALWVAERQKQPADGEPAKPVIKLLQVVKPAELVAQAYLETDGDIEAFLSTLREKLRVAIAENKRIQAIR